jgi:glycosyltransferase involved in cell wall biosynthesis
MRVLQIVQKPQRRGAEVFAHQLSAWMRDHGHVAQVFHLYAHEDALSVDAGDVISTAREASRLERLPGLQPGVLVALRKAVRALRPDIVQLNGGRSVKYGMALRLLTGDAFKIVYRNIDSPRHWVRGSLRLSALRTLMASVDGVVAVSEQTLDEVRTMYRLPCPHRFIPNGVDLRRLTPQTPRAAVRGALSTAASSTVLLFFGALGPQKRPDRFLRLVAQLRAGGSDVTGWLLGGGPQRATLERQARDAGITEHVRFLGARDDVGSVVAAADIHISCSDTEGIPAAVIEANALGVPTVAFRVGGLPECIVDGDTGVLVAPGDEAALARAALDLVNDRRGRDDKAQSARTFVTERFDIDRIAAAYVAFYEDLSRVTGESGNMVKMNARKGRQQMPHESSNHPSAADHTLQVAPPHMDRPHTEAYVAPVLGGAVQLVSSTLFSGTVNPDAGTIDFGD